MMEQEEIHALVVSDVNNPLGVLLVPRSLITEEMLVLVMDAADELDQFITPIRPSTCQSIEEVRSCILELNGRGSV